MECLDRFSLLHLSVTELWLDWVIVGLFSIQQQRRRVHGEGICGPGMRRMISLMCCLRYFGHGLPLRRQWRLSFKLLLILLFRLIVRESLLRLLKMLLRLLAHVAWRQLLIRLLRLLARESLLLWWLVRLLQRLE